MAASDDSPISGPGTGEDAPVRRTPVLTEATPKDEIEDAVEVPATEPFASAEPEADETAEALAADGEALAIEALAKTQAPASTDESGGRDTAETLGADAEVLAAAAIAGAAVGAAGATAAASPAAGGASSASTGPSGSAGSGGAGGSGGASASSMASAPQPAGGGGFGRVVTAGVAAVIGGVIAIAAQPYLAPYLGAPAGANPAALAALSERVTKLEGGAVQIAANAKAIAALQAAAKAAPAAPAAAPAPVASGEALPVSDALAARLGELAGRVEALTGQGDVLTRLTGELGAYSGELSAVKTRLETMATAIATASSDITAAKEQLAALSASDEKTATEIAGLQAALVAVDGRLGAVVGLSADLKTRMEAIEGTKGGALGDRSLATVALALTAFSRDLDAGKPFAEPLAVLAPLLPEPAPAAVVAAAPKGLPTVATLRAGFEEVASQLDIAVTRAEGGSTMLDRLLASAKTLVQVRSTEPGAAPPTRNPVEEIRAALALGDLPGALAVAKALPPQTAGLVGDWTKQLQARVEASGFLTAAGAQFLARVAAAVN